MDKIGMNLDVDGVDGIDLNVVDRRDQGGVGVDEIMDDLNETEGGMELDKLEDGDFEIDGKGRNDDCDTDSVQHKYNVLDLGN